jgi:hypothetical protein
MGNPTGDSTITNLPVAATLNGSELVAVDQTVNQIVTTVKIPVSEIVTQLPPSAFGVAMLAWFLTLPTTLPAHSGILWNNGGSLSLS